ncbi:LuxR C-terminal-related transcriptional regulator [Neomoorella thermoacetica]|nr:LuxR C-terminal-related transcriptional regulator [Moorella thermoacetica]
MSINHTSELIFRLQLLQDTLSEETGLCLVLMDKNGKEITLPSGLPLLCFHVNQSDNEKCNATLRMLLKEAEASQQPIILSCHQELYIMGYKTQFKFSTENLFLIAGRTKDVSSLEKRQELFQAIYSLPLTNFETKEIDIVKEDKQDLIVKAYNLTRQEYKILNLIGAGLSNKDIAAKLYISESTVKTHVAHILKKLRLSNRTEAAIFAVERGVKKQKKHD